MGWLGSEGSIDARPESTKEAAPLSVLAEADADADAAAAVAQQDPPAVAYEMLDPDALPRGGIDLKDHMSAIEIGLIRRALEEADGTVAGAARLLRIRRTTLVEKLRKYRLSA